MLDKEEPRQAGARGNESFGGRGSPACVESAGAVSAGQGRGSSGGSEPSGGAGRGASGDAGRGTSGSRGRAPLGGAMAGLPFGPGHPAPPRLDLGTVHRDLFTRPANLADKTGTTGTKVGCNVNFVKVTSQISGNINQYHVGFEPELDSKQMRIEVVRDQCAQYITTFCIFDGMILYMPRLIDDPKCSVMVKHPRTGEDVKVTFRLSVSFRRNDTQTINVYNLLIREAFKNIGYVQIQRNFYDPGRACMVKNYGIEVWPGYETAIRLYEDGLMLCIENRFKVLRKSTILDQMKAEFNRAHGDLDTTRINCDNTFTGQTIMTLYNNRTHRLSRFAWNMNPMSTFHQSSTNKVITFKQYYQEAYGVDVTDEEQPLIISEGKPKQPGEDPQVTYLIPELCQATGLTDSMRKDRSTMKALAEFTRMDPERRRASTMELLGKLAQQDSVIDLFKQWDVILEPHLLNLECRRLPPEKLIGRNEANSYEGRNAEWASSVKHKGNFRTVNLDHWVVLCPEMSTAFELAQKFIAEMISIGQSMSMKVADPLRWAVTESDASVYMACTETAIEKFKEHTGTVPQVVVVIVNDDNKTRYDAIKKLLCLDLPIPSQVVQLSTLGGKEGGPNRAFGSICLKILLQMNCKMGGAIWKTVIPMKKCMIVGYDLYHDSTIKGKTVGACVTSYDQEYTKWYSQTLPHNNPTELGDNLRVFVRKALGKYYKSNGDTLPDRIIVYRDGCGDGQIPLVKDNEVRLVQEAAYEAAAGAQIRGYEPKIAFIVVTKKVNLRVFRKVGDKLTNPEPGTVLDTAVTRPERYDFYLVPQFVNQGTVTPVCYNIIHDDTGLAPDTHQRLAFKLCHLYYNWQGTVRVPAPCQYAHKLAFLTAQTLHKETHESLNDKLFFL